MEKQLMHLDVPMTPESVCVECGPIWLRVLNHRFIEERRKLNAFEM